MNQDHALAISQRIRERHAPFGLILDPVCASPTDDTIVRYSRAGDSALWTGAWLAAESFRYAVTKSEESLEAVRATLAGINSVVDAGGLLYRCVIPGDSPYLADILKEQEGHGVKYDSNGAALIQNITRDQYSGVFFSLAVAFDFVEDANVRSEASVLATKLLNYLIAHNWIVKEGRENTWLEFASHPEQILTFLAIGRRVNQDRFASIYKQYRSRISGLIYAIMWAEARNVKSSYYKFNLAAMNFFNLLRLDDNSIYRAAYRVFRNAIKTHQNALFEVLDVAIVGTHQARSELIRSLLDQLAARPIRDVWEGHEVDYIVPIPQRTSVDFLWQESPFNLATGGPAYIELNRLDFILPYWASRYYNVIQGD